MLPNLIKQPSATGFQSTILDWPMKWEKNKSYWRLLKGVICRITRGIIFKVFSQLTIIQHVRIFWELWVEGRFWLSGTIYSKRLKSARGHLFEPARAAKRHEHARGPPRLERLESARLMHNTICWFLFFYIFWSCRCNPRNKRSSILHPTLRYHDKRKKNFPVKWFWLPCQCSLHRLGSCCSRFCCVTEFCKRTLCGAQNWWKI